MSTFTDSCNHLRSPSSKVSHCPKQKLHAHYRVTRHSFSSTPANIYLIFVGLFGMSYVFVCLHLESCFLSSEHNSFLWLNNSLVSIYRVLFTVHVQLTAACLGLPPLKMLLCVHIIWVPTLSIHVRAELQILWQYCQTFWGHHVCFPQQLCPFVSPPAMLLNNLTNAYSIFW